MKIKIGGKQRELKYSFNSFKYMEDLDLNEINKLETNPFKIAGLAEMLLIGAVNHNPKDFVEVEIIQDYLINATDEGELIELFQNLANLLEESSFFQSLQEDSEGEKEKEEKPKKK